MSTSRAVAPGFLPPTTRILTRIGGFVGLLKVLSFKAPDSNNVVRLIEDWLDYEAPDRIFWRVRDHPDYQVSFDHEVRGQHIVMFIDYDANCDFLGMYGYLQTKIEKEARAAALGTLNRLNYMTPFGNGEIDMDKGTIRYRIAVDVDGLRLSTEFLSFMLHSSGSFFDLAVPELMLGPRGVVPTES